MHSKEVSNLAEKIARLIEAETSQPDLSAVVASIEKISQRLDKMEATLSEARSPDPDRQSQISNSKFQISNSPANHPSQARFTLAEAIADAVIDAKTKEKACTFEPNGKPCDHCGMCSSRGF